VSGGPVSPTGPGAPRGTTLSLPVLIALARRQRREALAVLLLGVGGLLLPLPFWPLGALVAGFSRFWTARQRWLAWFGPALIALAGTVLAAAIVRGHANVVAVYLHVLWLDFRYLSRLGCVLTAGYLGWLVQRGPQVRVPPWRR
jgi:hypothetical protein